VVRLVIMRRAWSAGFVPRPLMKNGRKILAVTGGLPPSRL